MRMRRPGPVPQALGRTYEGHGGSRSSVIGRAMYDLLDAVTDLLTDGCERLLYRRRWRRPSERSTAPVLASVAREVGMAEK